MIIKFLNKILGIKKEDESNRGSSNKGLPNITVQQIEQDEDVLIENCKRKVQTRIEFYNQLKEIYNPSKDKEGSYTWSFMHNRQYMEMRKVSTSYMEEYQQKYTIKLPRLLIRVLTEVGSGGFINIHLINYEGKIWPPYACMEKEFLDKCLEAEIDPKIIENGITEFYDFENNTFSHSGIQKVYELLDSSRDKYLAILFDVGHDSSIVLNRADNEKLVNSNIPGITNLSFRIGNRENDSPYFKYTGETLSQVICPLNEHWWNKMKDDIQKMNKEGGV